MDYFIFKYKTDEHLIDSFLESASIAHKDIIKSKEWFLWKFRDNPFGESILSCAKTDGKIIACVAFGIQDFYNDNKIVKGAFSFETFVHPSHQGKGLFKELIHLAEIESQNRGIKFLLNFPNSNSLRGFIKSGWSQLNYIEYWIKPSHYFNLIFNLNELKKAFVPIGPSFNKLKVNQISDLFLVELSDTFKTVINNDYLKWRFFTFPVTEYSVINNNNILSIARIGNRGKLKEIQVLFVINKNKKLTTIRSLLKLYKKDTNYDIVSFPISNKNEIRKKLIKSFFIKVPNKTNATFKIIDETYKIDFNNLEISAINYHTY